MRPCLCSCKKEPCKSANPSAPIVNKTSTEGEKRPIKPLSSAARCPKAAAVISPGVGVGGDANLVDVIVVKKSYASTVELATSSTFGATANRRLRMRSQSNMVISAELH